MMPIARPTWPPDGQKESRTNATRCRRYLGSPPLLDVSFPDDDTGMAPTENLGICRHYHESVNFEAEYPMNIRRICKHRAPNAASCSGRIISMKPQGGARSSSLGVANDERIPIQYQGVVMVRLNSRLGVENTSSLVEPSPKADAPERSYIARTLVRDRR
jgi:hypothetical protein